MFLYILQWEVLQISFEILIFCSTGLCPICKVTLRGRRRELEDVNIKHAFLALCARDCCKREKGPNPKGIGMQESSATARPNSEM